ncbi:MAG: isoprenyl transferase [Candidatus Omnitrophota bacterium]
MLDARNIPKHIAIIMDGNGRWAKQRGLPRVIGHREGTKRVKEIIKAAVRLGVGVVTFFAFSSENWSRPKKEIGVLIRYLDNFLEKEVKELDKNNIRFRVIGRDEPLPKSIIKKIREAEAKTKDNSGLVLVLALNYGSRQEITEAAQNFARDVLSGKASLEDFSPEVFSRYLYTAGLPDPDLLIRTSGEMRVSNFLLWQLSYAELYFPKKYWPDFKSRDFEDAVEAFQKRERRFGGI